MDPPEYSDGGSGGGSVAGDGPAKTFRIIAGRVCYPNFSPVKGDALGVSPGVSPDVEGADDIAIADPHLAYGVAMPVCYPDVSPIVYFS